MRNVRRNTKWTRSSALERGLATLAMILGRRTCSVGHQASVRNISTSGTRYFSINGGSTNIVNFNQNPSGDLGDWASASCPQARPYVQNAFFCPEQASDIAAASPEGINLDVIGYNLATATVTTDLPTHITNSSVRLNGTVSPNGLTTTVHFEYGHTTSYGSGSPIHSYSGNTTQHVSIRRYRVGSGYQISFPHRGNQYSWDRLRQRRFYYCYLDRASGRCQLLPQPA